MIVVTGAAGFIGSNLIRRLNELGETNILAVDSLVDGTKFKNLAHLEIQDYIEKDAFVDKLQNSEAFKNLTVCFHQGACSTTTEWDGRYLVENNYEYSKSLYHYCLDNRIPFIYASSASVYGLSAGGSEVQSKLDPLNPYAYTKLLFDNYVRKHPVANSQTVGLRYFNVYGPFEEHKDTMASVIYHFYHQLCDSNVCRLFGEYDGYPPGMQKRDFVFVDDIADINIWMWKNPHVNGIYNCGTGEAVSFNQIAQELISQLGAGRIEYIPFPEKLKGSYQSHTCADISSLRQVGYQHDFTNYKQGVARYLEYLQNTSLKVIRTGELQSV